jgi:uncharacterized membrane protein
VTPLLIAIVLVTGLLALLPTRRLAERTRDPWLLGGYFVVLWLVVSVVVAVPAVRRLAIPLAVVLAVAPFVTLRAGIDRLLGRRSAPVPPTPRNVTPPDA